MIGQRVHVPNGRVARSDRLLSLPD
ncbi:BnaAnng35260D [Brassica napus]|uniref:BnaAnng35260D protein n=1 Tax=Brassica napus TaxID=3708 RepID=A0A078JYX0_BRANA|nr:BnaAnng35260D [Brassica napus]